MVIVANWIGYNTGYNILTIEVNVCIGFNTPGMVFIVANVKIGLNCWNVVPIIVAKLMLKHQFGYNNDFKN